MPLLNTSRAKSVTVDLFDYDNLPLSATYRTNGTSIDLTNWKFEFVLNDGDRKLNSYVINAGEMVSMFLDKLGAENNILAMERMWEDIRDNHVVKYHPYRLVQIVTDENNIPYVHIVYNLNVGEH